MKYHRSAANIDWGRSPSGRSLVMKSYQYDAVIDIMLQEPGVSLSEIGRRLGKSPAWMTWVTKSDAFRDIYDERRRRLRERTDEELNSALTKVARTSLGIIGERLEKNPAGVSTGQALEIADKALERLGYGVKLPGTVIDARSASLVLSSEDFALAQSVVRGLEADRANATPSDKLTPVRGAVAPPVDASAQAAERSQAAVKSVRDILDSYGFAMGFESERSEDES